MKPKNDKAVSTRISTATWEWLISFGAAGGVLNTIVNEAERAYKYGISPYKISESIAELQMIRRRSEAELKGVFTPAEWMLMADSLNGTIATSDFRCYPSALAANIEDSDKFDNIGEKWGVDVPRLIDKINRLTSAQVDAVFSRIEAFWNDENRDLDSWSKW
ncbi:MAG: hypothetical protein PWQ81_171 [Bacteroidota bacterium]|nr:hypothetical protein [Bacteroidota bacterium]